MKVLNTLKKALKKNLRIKYFYENIFHHPIFNLYNDKNDLNCLLSYSVFPFIQKKKIHIHPNFVECHSLTEKLRDLGYNIDIYNSSDKRKINYLKYDLIVGEGIPMSNYFLAKNKDAKAKIIYYSTCSHPAINNLKSLKALVSFYKKYDIYLPESSRFYPDSFKVAASLSDAFIVLGNNVTKKTFSDVIGDKAKIYTLNPPFYAKSVITDFSKKKRNAFLWFGSYGLIHKDLNTVLEIFINHPEWILHICGRFDEERRFMKIYENKLKSAKNIIQHGYIDVTGNEFKKIISECSFVILSSCAEGCSTAIETATGNGGLIPIISDECGFTKINGEKIISGNCESILEGIEKSQTYDMTDIIEFSKANIEYVGNNFSIDMYKKNLNEILEKIVKTESRSET